MSAKENKSAQSEENIIARNRKARFEFEILEKFEAGMELRGSEVKSLRNRDVSINEAFVRPRENELWVMGMNIKPYAQAGIVNHDPVRPRKLLMHRGEINRIANRVAERGYTIVPLTLLWRHGIAKIEIAVVRGRKKFDKREAIKTREAKLAIRRATGRRRG